MRILEVQSRVHSRSAAMSGRDEDGGPGDLIRKYEDLSASEPSKQQKDKAAEADGGLLDQYERAEWESKFRPKQPERNVRVIALGDALSDADITGSRDGQPKPLRELSGDIRSSILQAHRGFYCSGDKAQILERGVNEVSRGMALCESPIERHILPWLVFANWGIGKRQDVTPVTDSRDHTHRLFILCQAPVASYRLDFLITYRGSGSKISQVALECDGADYHDPVKDAARDLALLEHGILTVRASGREIYDRPGRVVARVDEAFYKLGGY